MFRSTLLQCLLLATSHAWVQHTRFATQTTSTTVRMEEDPNNPCWQNMLDDDCSWGQVYASNFVAGNWIKSMPCGANLEDCDMPTQLAAPDIRPEAHEEKVDVMDFLGLKRAKNLSKTTAAVADDLSP